MFNMPFVNQKNSYRNGPGCYLKKRVAINDSVCLTQKKIWTIFGYLLELLKSNYN